MFYWYILGCSAAAISQHQAQNFNPQIHPRNLQILDSKADQLMKNLSVFIFKIPSLLQPYETLAEYIVNAIPWHPKQNPCSLSITSGP